MLNKHHTQFRGNYPFTLLKEPVINVKKDAADGGGEEEEEQAVHHHIRGVVHPGHRRRKQTVQTGFTKDDFSTWFNIVPLISLNLYDGRHQPLKKAFDWGNTHLNSHETVPLKYGFNDCEMAKAK